MTSITATDAGVTTRETRVADARHLVAARLHRPAITTMVRWQCLCLAVAVGAIVAGQYVASLLALSAACLPFALRAARRCQTSLDRGHAGHQLRHIDDGAAAGSTAAQDRADAISAVLASEDPAAVHADPVLVRFVAPIASSAASGLALALAGERPDPCDVLTLADIVTDPLHRILTLLVTDLPPRQRLERVRTSIGLADATPGGREMYARLGADWWGTLDDLDLAVRALLTEPAPPPCRLPSGGGVEPFGG